MVEEDGECLARDAAAAEQRGEEAEEQERVVGREEAHERQELRLIEPAGLGGGARKPARREADEERGEGGGRVGEPALRGSGVEEVERALRERGGRDEVGELRVVAVPRRRRR